MMLCVSGWRSGFLRGGKSAINALRIFGSGGHRFPNSSRISNRDSPVSITNVMEEKGISGVIGSPG
jgi:hypothetical protein